SPPLPAVRSLALLHTCSVRSVLAYIARSPLFFSNDTATTEIYPLSLHDALPIYFPAPFGPRRASTSPCPTDRVTSLSATMEPKRSEEHTSELQSLTNLVCRLLLEKKKQHERSIASGRRTAILAPAVT